MMKWPSSGEEAAHRGQGDRGGGGRVRETNPASRQRVEVGGLYACRPVTAHVIGTQGVDHDQYDGIEV
jgi:hypothetical protein